MALFINHRLLLNTDLVAAIYPSPGERPQSRPDDQGPAWFTVILKDVQVAASGDNNNFSGPPKIEVSRVERNAIIELMQGAWK